MEVFSMKVKPILMRILKDRGMTQMELSELSGVPQGTISRFDKNDRFQILHLFNISMALGVNIEDLFEVINENE